MYGWTKWDNDFVVSASLPTSIEKDIFFPILSFGVCQSSICASHQLTGSFFFLLTPSYSDVGTVCGVNWYYCPRDPGCLTYTMSVHSMEVHANDYTGSVEMDKLKIGNSITIQVSGVTTIEKVPVEGSYRIYGIDGKNVATGILTDTLKINYNTTTLQYDFVMTVPFTLDSDNFVAASKWNEWTLDVFQQKSGSDEGMCVEFADNEYVQYEIAKPSPKFEDLCVDNGDGTFKNQTIAISEALQTLHTTDTKPACHAPKQPCDLKWDWCP